MSQYNLQESQNDQRHRQFFRRCAHTGKHVKLYLVDALKATQFAMNNLLTVSNRVRDRLTREFDEQAFEWVEAEVFTSIFVKRK